ncbi:MAG: hypothetical protein WC273_00410 [Dehalococcoidia bacterium]
MLSELAPPVQVQQMRDTFYAGAYSAISYLLNTEEQLTTVIEDVGAEMEEYVAQMLADEELKKSMLGELHVMVRAWVDRGMLPEVVAVPGDITAALAHAFRESVIADLNRQRICRVCGDHTQYLRPDGVCEACTEGGVA